MLKLHDYQVVARDWLRNREQAALFLDMGLGKTAATLCALEDRHLPALVVAPKRVAEQVWPVEARKWRPDLGVVMAVGSFEQREQALKDTDADIVVVSQDNLPDVLKVKRGRHGYRTLIIDELSGYKHGGRRGALRWRVAHRIAKRPRTEHVWGLTGTPAPNGLLDLCGEVGLLDNQTRLGDITTYKSRYFEPGKRIANGTIVEWKLKPGAREKIYAAIEDICLSMETDGRIDLPPITFNEVAIELPDRVKDLYNTFAANLVVDLREFVGGEVHTAGTEAIATNKLSQMTAGFMYVDDADLRGKQYTELHKEKIHALQEILDGTGSPVLVFYRFKAELEMLQRAFPQGRNVKQRGAIDAWDKGEIPLMFAHPASAGHGLNLQHGGHTAVWTSLDWNLEWWEQANKRLHRQGQEHPVIIHLLMANRTVDHRILARLQGKADVQNSLLDHLESPI